MAGRHHLHQFRDGLSVRLPRAAGFFGYETWHRSSSGSFTPWMYTTAKACIRAARLWADINGFVLTFSQSRTAVGLDRDVGAILVHFLRGLSGRALRIETAETNCTDTEVVYLPGTINAYPSREKNLSLYRLIATQLWAQTRFGTFRRASPNAPRLSEQLSRYSDPKKAQQLFERLEQARLDACIRRTLPGLGRQMDLLLNQSPKDNPKWQALIAPLCCADATVTHTLAVLEQAYRDSQDLALAPPWAGGIDIALAEQTMDIRTQREREQLQTTTYPMVQRSAAGRQYGPRA